MSRNSVVLVVAGLLGLLGGTFAAAHAAETALLPHPLDLPLKWEARQFIQADAKGRVFLLRGDTLDVYPLSAGKAGKPARLEQAGSGRGEILSAAMSQGGGRWLLLASNQARLFEGGKEKPLISPGWVTTTAGFSGEDPVVAVLPMRIGRGERPKTLPQLLKYDGKEWGLLVPASLPASVTPGDFGALLVHQTVSLISAPKSRLWMLQPYAYRFSRFSGMGKRDFGIVVAGGQITYRKDLPKAQQALEDKLEARGYKTDTMTVGATPAQRVLLGGAQGRDGRLYLVSRTGDGGGLSLDRYDTVTTLLERAPLRLTYSEELSVAAGRDGLFLVSTWGQGGRWSLSWEEIDAAPWKEVSDVDSMGASEKERAAPASNAQP